MSSGVSEITVGSEHNGAARGSLAALEGAWRVSPERSTIGFRVKKMGMYYVKGRFQKLEGGIEIGPVSASGEVTIEAGTVSTSMPPRDAHLRSRDFLEVKRYPSIRVSASSIEADAEGVLRAPATFELHGSRKIVELEGHAHAGEDTLVLHLTGSLDRHAFGIRPRQPFEMVVGAEVLLDIELVLEPA